MDAHTRAFGSFQVRAIFEDGRFGPVFLADDPASGSQVVIRTFTQALTAEQRESLLGALRDLCELPLDHPAVARPISCGVDGDTPYFVHAYVDGIPADEYLAANGPSRLAELVPLITPAAAAIDFAAAAGVTHSALSFRDLIIGERSAGVSGFGLVQALQTAGIDTSHVGFEPAGSESATSVDIRALARITSRLLVPDDAVRMRHLVEEPPPTALGLVAALQDVIATTPTVTAESAPSVADQIPMHRQEPEPVMSSHSEHEPELEIRDTSLIRDTTFAPSFAATSHLSPPRLVADQRSQRSWLPLAVAASLAVGLVSGFAAGVVVGKRDAKPAPVARSAPQPQPTATAGQIFTEQATADSRFPVPGSQVPGSQIPRSQVPGSQVPGSQVPSSAVPSSTVPSSEVPRSGIPSSGVRGSGVQANAERTNRERANLERGTANRERANLERGNLERGTGNRERRDSRSAIPPSLWVESRPMGASVYVDGQLVGRTPLLLGGINPGGHSVKLDMGGYHQWATRVNVADSGRTRVAASLEQQ